MYADRKKRSRETPTITSRLKRIHVTTIKSIQYDKITSNATKSSSATTYMKCHLNQHRQTLTTRNKIETKKNQVETIVNIKK